MRQKLRFTLSPSSLGIFLVIPCMIVVVGLNIFPVGWAVYTAFSDYDFASGMPILKGVDNFLKTLTDPSFQSSVRITLTYSLVLVLVASSIGLLMAIVANQEFRGREILRSLLVIPWATPWIVVGFLWGYILSGEFGLINGILRTLGIIHENIIFLSPEGAIFWTAVAAAWTQSSFTALLVLSGLQSIPDSLYEASEIDGAGIFQRFRHITLPWIQPIFNLCVLLNAMVGLTIFDIVFIMTRGGPGDRTLTLSILAYRTFFLGLDIGGGAAVSILLALLVLLVGIAYLTIFYRRMEFYR